MPKMIVSSPSSLYGARLATEAEVASGAARECDCGSCSSGSSLATCIYEVMRGGPTMFAKSATPTQVAGIAEFVEAAEPMLIEVADFIQASKAPGADQNATLAWDIQDPATHAVIAKVLVSRPGRGAGVAKVDGAGTVVGWRQRLQEGLRSMLASLPNAGIEDAGAKLATLVDAFREDLLQARRDEVTSFGGKVDVAAAFTAEQLAAQRADAVAKAGAAAANAAKVAQLAKQAPRRAPFVWPSDLAKEAREEGADRLLKTADELRIRDLGEQVRHDQRREQILKAVDRELAHLPEQERRDALRPSRELGFRVLEHAVRHDQRRHELIEKHRGAR